MAELVAKLSERLGPKPAQENATEGKPNGVPAPNRDRLTVGLDLGDQGSNYCILGLAGETLAEGQLRTTRDVTQKLRTAERAIGRRIATTADLRIELGRGHRTDDTEWVG
jgi:hypothetical protein